MKILKAFVVVAIFTAGLQAMAAIPCRPGMGNCPGVPGDGPPRGREQITITVIGYAEVPSPSCNDLHLQRAINEATEQAISQAEYELGTTAILTRAFRYTNKCEQGITAESARGNSWIVQAFAEYSRPKNY